MNTRWALAGLVLLALTAPLSAVELGDPAPALQISEWVKGAPVDVTKKDRVYVVEFWATWCGPCIQSIPHVTEMQKNYGDKVTFIGVSSEDPHNNLEDVKKLVDAKGDKMAYTVAFDDGRKTYEAYMGAYSVGGIPTAFVVDQAGRMVWHSHPMQLEETLDQVLAGKFDLAAAKAKKQDEARLKKFLDQYHELVMSADKEQEAQELGARILELGADNDQLLNAIAWNILTDENIVYRDKALALKAAELANKKSGGEHAGVLDTYALALYENGKRDEAIKTQEKALKIAKQSEEWKSNIAEFEERLERFKKGE